MGLIREPKGVDLVVEPSILTEQDKQMISEIIANYKRTGKRPSMKKGVNPTVKRQSTKKVKA